MKRNDLTPTVITDKNGKTTTVHKKSDVTRKRVSLPAPGGHSKDKIKEQAMRVEAAFDRTHGRQDLSAIKRFLGKMDDLADVFVETVEKAAKDNESGREYGKANLSYLILALHDEDTGCRRTLTYHDVFPENIALTDTRFVLKRIAESYGGDKSRPEYREQVRAHLYASANYQRHDDKDFGKFEYEDNDELFDIVMRRPEDVEEIIRLHNEYKVPVITDEIIEEYRNHHTSLGHGIL